MVGIIVPFGQRSSILLRNLKHSSGTCAISILQEAFAAFIAPPTMRCIFGIQYINCKMLTYSSLDGKDCENKVMQLMLNTSSTK